MAADLRSTRFGTARRFGAPADDADPMSSVANLADVMLVFACGLMMALVMYWNIDVTSMSELEQTRMEPIDNPEELPQEMTAQGSSYVERGTVYQDPRTGKYYLLTEEKDAIDDDLAATSGTQQAPAQTSSVAAPDRASGAD